MMGGKFALMLSSRRLIPFLVAVFVFSSACTQLFYASMKKLGKDKRDILVSRILDAKKAQQDASKQFQSALEAFQAVTNFDGGDLEKSYKNLNGEYEDAASRAQKVSDRVDSIEKVSKDLFKEWGGEIEQMSEGRLKQDSRALLRKSEQRNHDLVRQMRGSEQRMRPVLQKFHDRVLFLKHDLNARAIGSLKGQAGAIDAEVAQLVKDIEASNEAADRAIAGLTQDSESK